MATLPSVEQSGIQRLQDRLMQFETQGFHRSKTCLLSDYVQFLVDHQLLPQKTGDRIAALYNRERYGNISIEAREWDETIAELDASLELLNEVDESQRRAMAEHLHEQLTVDDFVTDQAAQEQPPPEPPPVSPFEINRSSEQHEESVPHLLPTRKNTKRWAFTGMVLLCWTLAVAAIGHYYHEPITTRLRQAGVVPTPPARTDIVQTWPKVLRETRHAILGDENTDRRSRNMDFLVNRHEDRKEYAEIFFLYERLLERDPNNLHLKHNLAVHLLTAGTDWHRDTERAFRLAKEVVQVKRRSYFLHTLAEAHHQMGDHRRAIELEEEILTRKPRGERFYKKQLLKFRYALAESESELPHTQ